MINSFTFFQPIVKAALPIIIEPLLNLLKTLHLEVQYEGKYIMWKTSMFCSIHNFNWTFQIFIFFRRGGVEFNNCTLLQANV